MSERRDGGAGAGSGQRGFPGFLGLSSDSLAARIAEGIIAGRFPPGTSLDETGLAATYSVSRTPVREALRQLTATGLVESRPRRGTIVASPTDEDLHAVFVVMAELEALCASLAAEAMSPRDRQALETLHLDSGRHVRMADASAYATADVGFHEAIYQGSGNPYLADITRATHLRLAPFRKAQFDTLGRLAASFQEHGAIVDAILRGDKVRAAVLMREHIGTVELAYSRLAR
jgi:DNA-binding GntR family transcriptional regulator